MHACKDCRYYEKDSSCSGAIGHPDFLTLLPIQEVRDCITMRCLECYCGDLAKWFIPKDGEMP